ncbi:uncharacterized protein LOC132554981 [Ylistrum balloti]|uniref:uncharacterized protein LOC132554981 n=1 Tax=Ylistrum balloti TaxID=509963 RepID=UPI0029059709|nr:uncharacterized protein LOC132554981 [Ylistrum balloti]
MSTSDEEDPTIVLDNGSYKVKAGYAGDNSPRSIFRTLVGTPLYQHSMNEGMSRRKCYVGDQVIKNMDALDVRRPIERGIVTDWDVMETVWHHVFSDLRINPIDNNVLVTEPLLNPMTNREKMAQVMFEKIQPRGMYVISPNILSLYASGRMTGLVINSGYEVTSVICVYEGFKIAQSIFRSDIGGNDVTNYLIELLGKRGYSFTTDEEQEEVHMMKEICAYVSENPKAEMMNNVKTDYTLSNGNTIHLGHERFQCMEAMFKPELIGSNAYGIHELIVKSIEACPIHHQTELCSNIILSGSNTMQRNIASRVDQELKKLLPSNVKVKVIAPPERRSSTWIGGSVICSLTAAEDMWMRPADYDEFGPNIIFRPEFNKYG